MQVRYSLICFFFTLQNTIEASAYQTIPKEEIEAGGEAEGGRMVNNARLNSSMAAPAQAKIYELDRLALVLTTVAGRAAAAKLGLG